MSVLIMNKQMSFRWNLNWLRLCSKDNWEWIFAFPFPTPLSHSGLEWIAFIIWWTGLG